MTKDHPPHWRQVQEKSFQDHKQSSSGAQMKSTKLILLVGNVQTQEKHEQAKKKKRWERIPAEKGAPKIEQEDRRTKVRSESSI